MTQSTATIQVNEFTDEERERIHNEVSKIVEPEDSSMSPTQLRVDLSYFFNAASRLIQCTHPMPLRLGPYTYCGECGSLERPGPMTPGGSGPGTWRLPHLAELMQGKK